MNTDRHCENGALLEQIGPLWKEAELIRAKIGALEASIAKPVCELREQLEPIAQQILRKLPRSIVSGEANERANDQIQEYQGKPWDNEDHPWILIEAALDLMGIEQFQDGTFACTCENCDE